MGNHGPVDPYAPTILQAKVRILDEPNLPLCFIVWYRWCQWFMPQNVAESCPQKILFDLIEYFKCLLYKLVAIYGT